MSIGIGEPLRAAREDQGRTIEEASRATRVRADYLRALEEERFDVLGGDVYAKGFLATYARWLDLDPEPLLERYREQVQAGDYDAHALIEHPVARPPAEGASNWIVWGAVLGVVLLAALAIIGTFGGRSPQPAAEPGIGTPSPSPGATDRTPATETTPTPTPSPTPTSVELEVLVEADSWMRVRSGDEVLFEGTLRSGATRSFSDPDDLRLRLGNAGGVRLILNGEEVGSVGPRGAVVEVTCTPTGCTAEGDEGDGEDEA